MDNPRIRMEPQSRPDPDVMPGWQALMFVLGLCIAVAAIMLTIKLAMVLFA